MSAVGGTAWPRGGHPVGQVRPQPWEGGLEGLLLMVLGRGKGGAAGSPVSRVPGADVASSGDSNPARCALGGPRQCAARTRLLPSHL